MGVNLQTKCSNAYHFLYALNTYFYLNLIKFVDMKALIDIMAWRRVGEHTLSELVIPQFIGIHVSAAFTKLSENR